MEGAERERGRGVRQVEMEGCSLSHNDYALWAWDMRVRHPCDVTSALYDVTCGAAKAA